MAFIGTQNSERPGRFSFARLVAQAKAWLFDGSEAARTRRIVGTSFLIRVSGAVLAYVSQILLAVWMGAFQFGIYVYVWTWVTLLVGFIDLGMSSAAQRFIPQYSHRNEFALLRGFQSGSRWLVLTLGSIVAIMGAFAVAGLQSWLSDYEILPLYLGCLALPMCCLLQVQSGISRAYNWVNLAQLPAFVFRQVLIIVGVGALYLAAMPTDAVTATVISTIAVWIVAMGQFVFLNRNLAQTTPAGPRAYELKTWLTVSLPMMTVDGFYLLLSYSSILMLQLFRSPDEIAIFYAAEKTLALVAFVHFAVTQSTANKFSHYYVAGDREKLAAALDHAINLTFWPSLASVIVVLAAGIPLLWLFGRDFVAGYPLMFIFAVGMLARSAVGPLASFLNMVGQQRACAGVFGAAFAINVMLCLVMIPWLGTTGAAVSIAVAIVFESAALFLLTKRRLGFHGLVFGDAGKAGPPQ